MLSPVGVQAHLNSAVMFPLRMHIIYVAECAARSIKPRMSMLKNACIYEWLMSAIRHK